jgi:hypothetical protein
VTHIFPLGISGFISHLSLSSSAFVNDSLGRLSPTHSKPRVTDKETTVSMPVSDPRSQVEE